MYVCVCVSVFVCVYLYLILFCIVYASVLLCIVPDVMTYVVSCLIHVPTRSHPINMIFRSEKMKPEKAEKAVRMVCKVQGPRRCAVSTGH